ncbi:hypothetical protein C3477_06765 [Mycobacterium kansasii]|uniref:hypothetical protein n=1 Tax=Mycobacterium kansasii TaxID=1768 RepID=UPI000CDD973D|nr:hypothetical protein [Mycobacterium kansasii]POX90635.1 hypothetical protein C3B43_06495 [Mycobacterium kansasii]POY07661.1 hypothetical protein C3477_06765 [Mycobacterium kansasii]POY22662.1 hypothetical protein C3476_10450 [Mycobacterium kansasii]
MASYGFRLFTFKISKEHGRKDWPLIETKKDAPDWTYRDHVKATTQGHIEQSVHGPPPRLDGQDRNIDLDVQPVMQLRALAQRGGHLLGVIRHGRPAGHDLALPKSSLQDAEPIDISDYAPTREYRFALLFPDPGDEGVLAMESVSGACPARFLVQWMRAWSQQWGLTDPENPKPWFRIKVYALGDQGQLDKFLETSRLDKMVLVSRRTGASRQRQEEEFRLTSTLDSTRKTRAVVKLKNAVKAKQSDEDMAHELAGLLGTDVGKLDLDDGWLILETPGYGRRQVSPSRLPDVFTYPIGDTRPSADEFRAEVRQKVQELAADIDGTINFTGW